MFPNNQMSGYVTEMNRLFSIHPDNDTSQTTNMYSSSPFQTANRSSSSADSTSPESYTDLTNFNRQMYDPNSRPMFETPRPTNQYALKRRPIVGRKILGPTETVVGSPKTEEFDNHSSLSWQNEDRYSRTPPNVNTIFVEQKNYSHNVFYELFPEKVPELTPQKANLSPVMSNYSPTSSIRSNLSPPSFPRIATPPIHSRISTFPTPPLYSTRHYPTMSVNSSKYLEDGQTKMCSFCRKNGETPIVYMTHCVKEKVENKHIVTCPILRSHVCSTCGASGDNAHTITYCPVLRSCNNGAPLRSTTVTLKNTRLKSNGRRRY